MKTVIHKYYLTWGITEIDAPKGSRVLQAGVQSYYSVPIIAVWIQKPEKENIRLTHSFSVLATGEVADLDATFEHLTTVQLPNTEVYHIYHKAPQGEENC